MDSSVRQELGTCIPVIRNKLHKYQEIYDDKERTQLTKEEIADYNEVKTPMKELSQKQKDER